MLALHSSSKMEWKSKVYGRKNPPIEQIHF